MWSGSPTGMRYAVILDLDDLDLAEALGEAVDNHPGLEIAMAAAPADVVISDRAGPTHPTTPTLRLGSGPTPPGAPIELVLSAAHVLAAGLRLAPAAPAASPDRPPAFSPREREVLALMVGGAPNKAIARALGVSASTAKFHVAAILGKLGARNRAEAVSIALREGRVML